MVVTTNTSLAGRSVQQLCRQKNPVNALYHLLDYSNLYENRLVNMLCIKRLIACGKFNTVGLISIFNSSPFFVIVTHSGNKIIC